MVECLPNVHEACMRPQVQTPVLNPEGQSWTWRDSDEPGGTVLDLERQCWTWKDSTSTQLHSFPAIFHLSLEAFRNDQVIYLIIVVIKASETIYLVCQFDKRNKSNSSKN